MVSEVSRSKEIGTAAETAVVRWFQANGFPHAKRITLHGAKDIGDVHLGDGIPVVVEVKAGKAAEAASDGQLRAWLRELRVEVENAYEATGEGRYGVLVVKRRGVGITQVGRWWAITPLEGGDYLVRWLLAEFTSHHLKGLG